MADKLELTKAEIGLAQEWYQKLQYTKYRTLPKDETLFKRMRKFIEDDRGHLERVETTIGCND